MQFFGKNERESWFLMLTPHIENLHFTFANMFVGVIVCLFARFFVHRFVFNQLG